MKNDYLIFNGYARIGEASCLDDARFICDEYCKEQDVDFEFKRELNSGSDVTVLIYQYTTLYLETFVITRGYELE